MAFNLDAIQGNYVVINGKATAKSTLSDAQLKAAVAANPNILASGWNYAGGQVVKSAAPAAPAAPATSGASLGDPGVSAAERGAAGPSDGFDRSAIQGQYVMVNGKPTDKNTLTATQLRAAIATNPRILADGWASVGGKIIRVAGATGGGAGGTRPGVADPTPETPATPVVPPPPPPTLDQFGAYRDSTYWDEYNAEKRRYDDGISPLAARLAQLNTRIDPATGKVVTGGVGGKTFYDLLYEQQQQTDARNLSLSRSDAARKGVTRSGYWDQQAAGLASQSLMAGDKLVREWGTDANDQRSAAYQAEQERTRLTSQFEEAQRNLANSASNRGLSNALTGYQNTYGGY